MLVTIGTRNVFEVVDIIDIWLKFAIGHYMQLGIFITRGKFTI